MSYRPTPEQKQAAKDRRQKILDLTKRLVAMTDGERAQLVHGLATTIEGHTLSLTNQMLIAYQSIGQTQATVVGGFQQWCKAGRTVSKGQHGYAIWVPTVPKRKTEGESTPAKSDDHPHPGFILATVFDITQTEALTQ